MSSVTNKPWLLQYPSEVPASIATGAYASLVDMLGQACQRHKQRPALTFMGCHIRYGQLDRRADAVAAWLQAQNLPAGSRIGLMMPNVAAYMVVLLGVLRAGMVVVNINPLSTPHELGFILRNSQTRLAFVFDSLLPVFAQEPEEGAGTAGSHCRPVVVLPGDALGLKGKAINGVYRYRQRRRARSQPPLENSVRFSAVLAQGRWRRRPQVTIAPEDLAILQYTGGTTGVPKGAMLSHRNLVANVLQMQAVAQPVLGGTGGAGLVMLTALPLCHVFALTVCGLFAAHSGMQSVLVADPRRLADIVTAWRKTPISILPAVNTLFNALLRNADFTKLDFSALRLCFGGGAPVQEAVAERWQALTGLPIIEGYGLTETSPVALVNPVNAKRYSGDIGFPLPSTDVKIIDDDGRALAAGSEGEIAIKGPQVMEGYWQQPHETQNVFTADGYLRTGDIGVMSPEGRVRIVDRKKDMVLVAGFNVYPNEIEQVAAAHPDVQECVALGVPGRGGNEKLKLYVVKADDRLTEEALREWLIARLSSYKRPHGIEFRTELPKSHAGKLLRRVLRDEAKRQPESALLSPALLVLDEHGVPYSPRYGDVYHPRQGALAQAAHVFLAGNSLPKRWGNRHRFAVCETGFGLGHNFLALWQAWLDDPQRCHHLHFVSFEAHPFQAADLRQALSHLPETHKLLLERLLAQWPDNPAPGVHQLVFEGDSSGLAGETAMGSLAYTVTLSLVLGDIHNMAPQVQAQVAQNRLPAFDAFFLDGFAPRTNPQMWTASLFRQLADMAAPGATAATWSSAAKVREGLSAAGFCVQRQKGFGNKRHMIIAALKTTR